MILGVCSGLLETPAGGNCNSGEGQQKLPARVAENATNRKPMVQGIQ